MATIGLKKIIIAPWKSNNTYNDAFLLGKAIGVQVNPNYAEGSLYADDEQAEYDKEFRYAEVTLNTTTIPAVARKSMFGHEVGSDSEEIVFNTGDESAYVGTGWVTTEKVDGKKKYVGNVLLKCKYSEPSEDYASKGDSIEYKTPSITGRAVAQSDGDWKCAEAFDTENEAWKYVTDKLQATKLATETAATAATQSGTSTKKAVS